MSGATFYTDDMHTFIVVKNEGELNLPILVSRCDYGIQSTRSPPGSRFMSLSPSLYLGPNYFVDTQ